MAKKPLISILVPVYNEEKTILIILNKITRLPIDNYEVLVVNDASKDKSLYIINKFAKKFKAKNVDLKIFSHSQNNGKGAGIKTGLSHAKGEYFVIQDADLEYDPAEIPKLLDAAIDNNYLVVYGSRFLGQISNMPRLNYIANISYNILLRLLYGVKMTDMHTCYKMVRTSLLKDLEMTANGFDYATELISKLLTRKIPIYELPINFNGRTRQEGKKIDFMDGIECLYKLLFYRLFRNNALFMETETTGARFIVVGVIGFLFNYAVLVMFTSIGYSHIVSEVIAAILALQVTFILHDRWTYKLHTHGLEALPLWGRYVSFISSNIVGSLITILIFGILYGYVNRLPALLLAAILGLIWNYVVNLYITWRPRKKS